VIRAAAAAAALAASQGAVAAERFDHRGSVNAFLAPGGGATLSSTFGQEPGLRWALLAGGGAAIDPDGNELLLVGRATWGRTSWDAGAWAGYRSYHGDERTRTFLDLQLGGTFFPVVSLGPRFGVGVQYELAGVAGVFGAAGLALGFGGALQLSVDVVIGVQLRSYWLEN
jgi:hypothetical protein